MKAIIKRLAKRRVKIPLQSARDRVDAHSRGITGGQYKQRNLSAKIIPCCFGTAVQAPGLFKAHQGVWLCVCVAGHFCCLAPPTVPGIDLGRIQDSTPGTRARGQTAWCRHMMGVWLLSRCPLPRQGMGGKRPGTGHRQLVKLAHGAHSILSHAIVPFRQAIFWQEPLVLLLLLFQAVPSSPTCKWALNLAGHLLAMCCHDF